MPREGGWVSCVLTCGAVAGRLLLFLLSGLLTGRLLSHGLGILLVFVHGPVKYVVVLEAFANKQIAEDLAKVRVVGFVVEAEGTSVVQVDCELIREPTAQNLGGSSHLLFHNAVVLLLLGGRLQSLPWERATAEVEHDIAQRFHVVTAGLF